MKATQMPISEYMGKVWYVYVMEYYLVMNIGILLLRAMWIDEKNFELRERVQDLKTKGVQTFSFFWICSYKWIVWVGGLATHT